MIVRYETLVAEPEEMLQKICDFIGEDFLPQMLSMKGAKTFREQGSNSSYGQRKPGVISTNSIGRYNQVLSARQIACIQSFAKQEMLSFNYELDALEMPLTEKLRLMVADWPRNLVLLHTWRIRETMRDQKGRKLPSYRIVPEATST
jgi:hypothetical protein